MGTKTIDNELEMILACESEEEKQALVERLTELHKKDDLETCLGNLDALKVRVKLISLEATILMVTKYGVSLTYIAEKFLGKSHSYLSQRLHGHVVKGKKVFLSGEEVEKISEGLKDLSDKLRELSASLVS